MSVEEVWASSRMNSCNQLVSGIDSNVLRGAVAEHCAWLHHFTASVRVGVETFNLEEEAPRAAAGLPAQPLWWRAGQALHRTAACALKPLRRPLGLKPAEDESSSGGGLRRRGSDLFDRQSGEPA